MVDHIPDEWVILCLVLEGLNEVGRGRGSELSVMEWASENGYIDLDDEEGFVITDEGREHVAADTVVPEWN